MKIKNLDLTNYGNTMSDFHIHINLHGSFSAQQLHCHDYFQIYYIIRGNVTHHLLSKESILSYGDAFIIPPRYPHYITVNSKNTEFYSCSFTQKFVSSVIVNNSCIGGFLTNLLSLKTTDILAKISIPSDRQHHMMNLLEFTLYEYIQRDEYCKETLLNSLSSILSLMARNYIEKPENNMILKFISEKQAVLYCIDYLRSNYTKDLSLDYMVKLSRMQRSDFCKLFKELSGYTFHTMLNNLRIEKSLTLIKSSKKRSKMKLISEICGYTSFSTFHRNFIKYAGVSPAEYYEQTRNSGNY